MRILDPSEMSLGLRHVYWLGGAPCSGKSTIADIIGNRFGLDVYHIDEEVGTRFGKFDPGRQPCLFRWTSSTWDELWMRPPDVLFSEVFQCYAEQFELALEDLMNRESNGAVLVEGNSLLPDLVAPVLEDPSRSIWMTPSEEFQRREYPRRGAWVQSILDQCSDPAAAFKNWMDRDVAFAARIAGRVAKLGLAHIEVDGVRTIEENAEHAARHFGLEPNIKDRLV